MTPADQLARMQEWLDTHPAPSQPRDLATLEDVDTLHRSFGGLSKHARTQQRRPAPIKVDDYGFDKRGRYYADRDIA